MISEIKCFSFIIDYSESISLEATDLCHVKLGNTESAQTCCELYSFMGVCRTDEEGVT